MRAVRRAARSAAAGPPVDRRVRRGCARDALPGHDGVPVAGIAGDQQSALYGQACLDPGEGKNTYGTGSFVLVNTGRRAAGAARPQGLLATVAWAIGQRTLFALEASIFVTGAAVQWLRDGLGIIATPRRARRSPPRWTGNDGVYLVPALTGLGSPHWDPYARGTIVGLTRGTGRAHLARAALEAIAYQTVDAVRAVEAVVRARTLPCLKADGGATANGWLMQFQADVLGIPVVVPGDLRDDGARRRAARRRGRRRLDPGGGPRALAGGRALRARDVRGRARTLLHGWERALERSRGWVEA